LIKLDIASVCCLFVCLCDIHISCGAAQTMHVQFKQCGKCQSQQYCSRACQVNHWKSLDSHKTQCSRMKREKSELRQRLHDEARTNTILRWNSTPPFIRQLLQQISPATKEELDSHFPYINPQWVGGLEG